MNQTIVARPSLIRRLAVGLVAAALVAGAVVPTYLLLRAKPPVTPVATLSASAQGITLAPGAPQWRYIEIAVAEAKPPLPPLPAPARVTFDEFRTSALGAPLPGRIESLLVHAGDRVEKGAKLFSMRSGAFAELRRDVDAAHAEAITKHRVADRVRDLVVLEAAAKKEQLAAEAEAAEADLAVSASTAKLASLKVAGSSSNLFWVVAPRRGTVVDLDASPSQEVTPDRDRPLMRISDLDEVLVLADVQEADAVDIQRGQRVEVHTLSGLSRPGLVDQVAEVVDPTRRTVAVRVRVRNEDRALRPNAMAEVIFPPASTGKRVRLPSQAVVTDGPRQVVFVAREGGQLDRKRVTTGRERDGETEVLVGLGPGERFVAKGALLLLNQIELVIDEAAVPAKPASAKRE